MTEGFDLPEPGGDVDSDALDRAADLVAESEHLVGFTGAGVSTESGIPDFRSPGGIWDQYDPSDFTIGTLRSAPETYWEKRLRMREESGIDWEAIDPNPAHEAFAALEDDGPLAALITQNVDGLHQAAGNDPATVFELHGTREGTKCLECTGRWSAEHLEAKLDAGEIPPRCEDCGGLLKRATVSFGEALPQDVLRRAQREARESDCFLVVGSSLTVEPAASLPRIALQSGASFVIVNLEPTPIDARSDVALHGKAGEILPAVVDRALS